MRFQLPDGLPLFAGGAMGGALAALAGLPMPFMLGGLAGAALAVALIERHPGRRAGRPHPMLRMYFVAVVGTMIGAGFDTELLTILLAFWPSMLAVLPFIAVAHLGGYHIMRRAGGFGRVDAFYASMPGGLVEAAILGERAGANVGLLAIQHFIRVILVVTLVPLLFWLVTGTVVGSAAGAAFTRGGYDALDIGLILVLSPLGALLGKRLRIPAGHLMGPLFFAAGLQVTGVIDISPPSWLLGLAQLVIGVGLGAQFSGIGRRALIRGLGAGLVAVGYMLSVSFVFALALARVVPAHVDALFLSFAPGGVTEMNLIALSLNLGPVIVAVHHLLRIVLSVVVANAFGRRSGFMKA